MECEARDLFHTAQLRAVWQPTYLGLCPKGSEGTTYAMLTTFSNLAGTIAFDISTALTEVWDVSSE